MSEILFILSLLGGLWAWAFFLQGNARTFWLITMGLIALVVLGAEIVGKLTVGFTISNLYWQWSVQHVGTHWLVMAIMLAGWLSLLWHLSAKVISKKDKPT